MMQIAAEERLRSQGEAGDAAAAAALGKDAGAHPGAGDGPDAIDGGGKGSAVDAAADLGAKKAKVRVSWQ